MRAVYLGGPITGLTFDDAEGWRETIVKRPDWPEGWAALSPMRDKEQFRVDGPLPSTFDEGAAAVRQRSTAPAGKNVRFFRDRKSVV